MRVAVVTSSRGVSLQVVASHIRRVLESRGLEARLLTYPSLAHVVSGAYSAWITVMTFDPLWATPFFIADREARVNGLKAVFYATVEGKPRTDVLPRWVARDLSFVACSRYVQSKLTEAGVRVEGVVHHGVDLAEFRNAGRLGARLRSELGLGEDDFLVLYVAGGYPRKGHDLFAKVISEVSRRDPSVRFLIVTDDSGAAHYAGLGNATVLRVFGEVPNRDVSLLFGSEPRLRLIAAYGASDVYAQASLAEGFGLPVLEALASGKLVVHPDYEPLSEVTDRATSLRVPVEYVQLKPDNGPLPCGILYEHHVYDPAVFAEVLLQAKDEVRRRRGEIARAAVERASLFDVHRTYSWFASRIR